MCFFPLEGAIGAKRSPIIQLSKPWMAATLHSEEAFGLGFPIQSDPAVRCLGYCGSHFVFWIVEHNQLERTVETGDVSYVLLS